MAVISRESILCISALLKCLIYVISENRSYDKALPKLLYLPNIFVLFINLRHFVIIEEGISFDCMLFDCNGISYFSMPISLSQYIGPVIMFNNILANKRFIRPRIYYRRKTQSCEFSLIIIFFILLQAFSILIGFLKRLLDRLW